MAVRCKRHPLPAPHAAAQAAAQEAGVARFAEAGAARCRHRGGVAVIGPACALAGPAACADASGAYAGIDPPPQPPTRVFGRGEDLVVLVAVIEVDVPLVAVVEGGNAPPAVII